MIDIAVVDYGMGNLRSVSKALEHVAPGKNIVVTSEPVEIEMAERVVFPGQGAMPDCMRELKTRNLQQAVINAAANKPFLGICIGLQLLFEHSEEGDTAGLGIVPGNVRRFEAQYMHDAIGNKLKVPHMGWNRVFQIGQHPMWANIPDGARFYFVHSYYVEPQNSKQIAAYCDYSKHFACAVSRANIFAVQFHPEKSHRDGLQLLTNFINWDGRC